MAFGDLMMSKFWMGINMHGVKYAPRLQRNQGCSLGFAQKTVFVLATGRVAWTDLCVGFLHSALVAWCARI